MLSSNKIPGLPTIFSGVSQPPGALHSLSMEWYFESKNLGLGVPIGTKVLLAPFPWLEMSSIFFKKTPRD